MTPIRTLIAEDEAPARQWLRALCAKHRDVQVIGECSSVRETSQTLRSTPTDLLLLDIHLGPHLGFHVLEGVPGGCVPLVIIVTAYDQYAVRAFERNAVDYLLKPVREERFAVALDRARRRLHAGLTSETRAEIRAALEPLQRLFLRGGAVPSSPHVIAEREGSLYVLDALDIEVVESSGNYIEVDARSGRYSTRATLQMMEESLPAQLFVRVNRSVIVNVTFVERIERDPQGAYTFVMKSGRRFNVGRSYRQLIAELIRTQGLLVRC